MSTITEELDRERLINVNEITRLMGVERTYFSKKIVKETNFLEIAPPFACTVTAHQSTS